MAERSNPTLIAQGERIAGDATVQLVTAVTPCDYIEFEIPTASHTSGTNTGVMLIGIGATTVLNKSGSRALGAAAGNITFTIDIDDASKIYVTGANAADSVEYRIYRE